LLWVGVIPGQGPPLVRNPGVLLTPDVSDKVFVWFFLILLPETGLAGAQQVAESICETLGSLELKVDENSTQ